MKRLNVDAAGLAGRVSKLQRSFIEPASAEASVRIIFFVNEIRRLAIERLGQLVQHIDRGRILLALEVANVSPVDIGLVSQRFLAEVADLPQPSHVPGKDRS